MLCRKGTRAAEAVWCYEHLHSVGLSCVPAESKTAEPVPHAGLTPRRCRRSCWSACGARWTPAWAARSTRAPTPPPCTPTLTAGHKETRHTLSAGTCSTVYNQPEFHTWLCSVSWTINSLTFLLRWKNINLLTRSKIPTCRVSTFTCFSSGLLLKLAFLGNA